MINKYLLTSSVLFKCLLFGDIVQVEKIGESPRFWDELDKNSLIVFDIDDVIISTEDHFAHPYGYLTFVELTNLALTQALTEEDKESIMHRVSLSQLLAKRRLVEDIMPEFIKNLQSSGFKVIALTNFPRGQYGAIPRTETWRIEYLKALDIDFSGTFPCEHSYEFHEFSEPGIFPPLFEDGILFSNGFPKGKVLKTFFNKFQFYPSKVVFIDDILHNHVSMKTEMDLLKIP